MPFVDTNDKFVTFRIVSGLTTIRSEPNCHIHAYGVFRSRGAYAQIKCKHDLAGNFCTYRESGLKVRPTVLKLIFQLLPAAKRFAA
jgi:hypothetical protein